VSMRSVRVAAVAALGIFVAACNGIGDGIKLESVSVVPLSIANTNVFDTVATTKIFRCVRDQVKAYGKFTDGEIGEYTTRGHWSSSDSSIVKVSNGDLIEDHVPGQDASVVFTPGTLTPVSPGTATVSFDYVGLHEDIQVTVQDLPDEAITLSPSDNPMAPGSSTFLVARADLDGTTADITNSATFEFVNKNDAVATLDTGGFVKAIAPGGPLTAKATFTACDATPTATVTVKPIENLTLTKEFPVEGLANGTSEKLTVTADFGDGTSQDLSLLATYCVAPDPQGFIAFLASASVRDYVIAANPGSVGITAIFPPISSFTPPTGADAFTCSNPPPADQFVQSNDIALTALNSQLCSIEVTAAPPSDPKTATIEFGSTQQFKATGKFTTATIDATHTAAQACADTANVFAQDITRHVTWTVSDTTVATIVTTASNFEAAGLAAGSKEEGGTVTVTAAGTASGPLSAVAQVANANTATLTITPKP